MMNLNPNNRLIFELGKVIAVQGYFLLEYTPDDGRGFIAHVDKVPLIGFAFAVVENKLGMFPLTLRGLYIHEENNLPSILCPCGGVLSKDVFLDSLEDFMQAMEYKHSMSKKG
jgi:hypothetical protein